jgi:hypothetical protein
MKTLFLTSLLTLAGLVASFAQTPVWSTDVASIIYNRCASCHHTGGIAPFNLMSYADAINHAPAMKAQVQAGTMPPWPPDPAVSRFAHERVLSAKEKANILDWLDGGRPTGDLSLAPPAPTFNDKGDLPGMPDLIVKIPQFTSTSNASDIYRCFVLPTGLSADKYITAFEAIPGNQSIVHHVLVYADTTGVSTTLDAADPGPGYTSFGGIGTSKAILLGGWVPGTSPIQYPTGFGTKLHKNAKLVMQIHYPAGTAGLKDSTELHLFFSTATNVRDVQILPALSHASNIDQPLVIPANTVKSFTEQIVVPYDVSLLGVAPHMHLLGKNIESFGVKQNGDTQRYISVPNWDFHWQGFYLFKRVIKIDAFSTAYARATYDNTSSNPNNPSNPPKLVQAGENTTDEMMVVYFVFALYQPGDENIVIEEDQATAVNSLRPYYKGVELLQPYPVPAQDKLIVKYHLDAPTMGSLELLNMSGQIVRKIFSGQKMASGYTALPVDVSSLPTGMYTLRLRADGIVKSQQLTIQR